MKKKCESLLDEVKVCCTSKDAMHCHRANLRSAVLNSVHFYIKSEYTYHQT